MRVRFPPTQDSIQNSSTLFDPVTCFRSSSLLLRPMLLQIRALASTAVVVRKALTLQKEKFHIPILGIYVVFSFIFMLFSWHRNRRYRIFLFMRQGIVSRMPPWIGSTPPEDLALPVGTLKSLLYLGSMTMCIYIYVYIYMYIYIYYIYIYIYIYISLLSLSLSMYIYIYYIYYTAYLYHSISRFKRI